MTVIVYWEAVVQTSNGEGREVRIEKVGIVEADFTAMKSDR